MHAKKDSTMLQTMCPGKLHSFMKLSTSVGLVVGGTGLGSEKVKTIRTECGLRGTECQEVHGRATSWYGA